MVNFKKLLVGNKKARSKILIGGILLVVSVLMVATIFALTDEERVNLENEFLKGGII